jgi:hypothetical protein
MGNEQASTFSGIYSNGDSDLLDCLENSSFTSIDFLRFPVLSQASIGMLLLPMQTAFFM